MTRKFLWSIAAILLAGFALYELQRPMVRPPDAGQGAALPALAPGVMPEERLGDAVRPRAYRLHLRIDPRLADFTGRVEIDVAADAAVEEIWLHGEDLEVDRAVLLTSGGETIRAAVQTVPERGLMLLALERPLDTSQATIQIDYRGRFNDALEGLYRVRAGDDWYVLSGFEPTAARRAFPAFDDPALQAPFRLSVRLPRDLVAVSNMPQMAHRELSGGDRLVIFAPTPPLPTYLVTLAVGPFDEVRAADIPPNDVRNQTVPLRGFAPRGQGAGLARALEGTAQFVAALEHYTLQPYPYAKLDLVAAPGLAGRGIGNPGAIFHDAGVILLGDDPSIDRLRRFHATHVDDLAHQWFGGLVTPRWWNDNWLSESFAAWMSVGLLAELRPELRFDREIQRGAARAIAADSLATALPLRQPVRSEAEIAGVFRPAVVDKGAAVLSMFEQYLGPARFRSAIRRYLAAHRHGSATTADFVQAVNEVHKDETLSAAFRSFLDQEGVPDVTLDWSCEGDGVAVEALYRRYLPLGVAAGDGQAGWQIPVCLRLLGRGAPDSVACMLLSRPRQTFYLRERGCPAAIVPNAGGRGYYLWSMPLDKLEDLGRRLNRMAPGEALSFAQSLSTDFRKGLLAPADYLRLLRPLTERAPWDAATLPMDDMRFLLRHGLPADASPARREAARNAVADLYRARLELGFEGMGGADDLLSTEERQLRLRLLEFFVIDLGDPFFRERLAADGRRHAADPASAPGNPDLRRVALAAAVLEDGEPLARDLAARLDRMQDAALRLDILNALAQSPVDAVIARLLGLLSGDTLSAAERAELIAALGDNPAAAPALWSWLRDNADSLAARLPQRLQGEVMKAAAGFCSPDRRADVEGFFSPRISDAEDRRPLDELLGRIDHCISLSEWAQATAWLAEDPDAPAQDDGSEAEGPAPVQ